MLLFAPLALLDDHKVPQHVERVPIRLQGDHALALTVHLQEAVVIQTHHLHLRSFIAPETHLSSTEGARRHTSARHKTKITHRQVKSTLCKEINKKICDIRGEVEKRMRLRLVKIQLKK